MPGRYSRYEDALIAQQRLLEWSRTQRGTMYLMGFYDDLNAKHKRSARRDVRAMAGMQISTLMEAEPIYVSPEALELVDHARRSWLPEKLLGSDAFVPNGFALFPRPVLLDDMPPTETNPGRAVPPGAEAMNGYIPVRAMAWMSIISEDSSVGTFWISFYCSVDDEFELADELGAPTRWETVTQGFRALSRDEVREAFPGLSLVHQWQWSWGNDGTHEWGDWQDPARYDVQPEDTPEQMVERARQQCSLVQTFWRIASQFITARERAPRPIWRNANRSGIQARDVTIITLRRERDRPDYDPEPTGREYHVSFLVRGYWAIRHTRNGPRQTWVRPHIKGDGPFQETERGWEFTR
jgi:hypothetical protein